jgi:hypothetical protein
MKNPHERKIKLEVWEFDDHSVGIIGGTFSVEINFSPDPFESLDEDDKRNFIEAIKEGFLNAIDPEGECYTEEELLMLNEGEPNYE